MAMVTPVDPKAIVDLWHDLAGNPRNRALVIARIVANHGDDALKACYAKRIQFETFPCVEREEALRILAPSASCAWLSSVIETTASPKVVYKPLRMDVEIGRLCIALGRAAEFRLWVVGRELVRQDSGAGKILRNAFYEALEGFGVIITRDHFNRLIRSGVGVFWDVDRYQETLYIRSPRFVAPRLAEAALRQSPALITTNSPGIRDMYISISDSHEAFEAALYAGWMAHREAPTISKKVLVSLFGRGEDTLRRWEQTQLSDTLTVRANYAQYHVEPNQWSAVIPDHAQPYLAHIIKDGKHTQITAYRWRISNTYIPHGIKQHPYFGQARKVYRNVQAVIERFCCGSPALESSSQPAYLQKPLKLYFENPKRLKRYVQKIGCDERYLWRGLDRNGAGIFEPTISYGQTHAAERAKPKDEYRFFKKQYEARCNYLATRVA